jgi:hypothetical protein
LDKIQKKKLKETLHGMLLNDVHLRFDLEKSLACLLVGKTGLAQEEEVVMKKFV